MIGLTFDPEPHRYELDGRRLPSVTEILQGLGLSKDLSFLDPFYRERGSATHACIELFFRGAEIDWNFDGVEHVRPRFEKFLRIADGLKPVVCEEPLASRLFSYAGMPDYAGPFQAHPLAILDWKGDLIEPAYHLQVAGGYRGLLWEAAAAGEVDLDPAEVLHCPCFLVPLGGNGELPRFIPIADDGAAMQTFRGCAAAYNWKLANHGDPRK